jgi:hypothetical protein
MRSLSQICRQIVFVSVLVLAFACSTFADVIQYPGVTASPPVTTNDEIQYPGATVDPATEIALSLLQSMLSLF